MPTWPTQTSWPATAAWPASTAWPGSTAWPSDSGFNGNFATLFTGVLQSVQSDLGLTYGGTMLAAGTTPPVITLTGALSGVPTAITITDTLPGILGTWTGLVTYGDATTQAFTSAATVALTGRGAGLTLNIAAGAALGDNTWKATCAGLADQSGNGKHFVQATVTAQPVITVGLNGFPGLLFDGVDDNLIASGFTMPVPGTTPSYTFAVFRWITWGVKNIMGRSSGSGFIFGMTATPRTATNNATNIINLTGAVVGTFGIVEVNRTNSASDPFKCGTVTVTGNAGNLGCTGWELGSSNGVNFSNMEFLALVHCTTLPTWTTIRTNVTAQYGASVLV